MQVLLMSVNIKDRRIPVIFSLVGKEETVCLIFLKEVWNMLTKMQRMGVLNGSSKAENMKAGSIILLIVFRLDGNSGTTMLC